ncbi:hypothetical protein AJ80_08049 [Polytolypa hystricis UAMH7299]|uniref:Uncharacterized protein n=1 Tax=Polytolypa hystricis (strain UAMH7299) TaxID=1447883 RepID=A0A2B7XEF3_POLH7|nr:hypothetical protein AJ80_08049 [Polytolypa hystricis UAMH7299]
MRPDEQVDASDSGRTHPPSNDPCRPNNIPRDMSDLSKSTYQSYSFPDSATTLHKSYTFQSLSSRSPPSKSSRRSTSYENLRLEPPLWMPHIGTFNITLRSPNSMPNRPTHQPSSLLSDSSPSSHSASKSAPTFPQSTSGVPTSIGFSSPLPLTPPDDIEDIQWNPKSNIPFNGSTDRNTNSQPQADELTSHQPSSENGGRGTNQQVSQQSVIANGGATSMDPGGNCDFDPSDDTSGWLRDGFDLVAAALPQSKSRGDAVQIVSHTLPCPAPDPSSTTSPGAAFTAIVEAIQRHLQPGQSPYIRIDHAVPPTFNMSKLPTSPPSTPSLQFPGNDYFNLTVFPHASIVHPYVYPNFIGRMPAGPPSTPAPIVPPCSAQVSVVERYLPPSSPEEYKALFQLDGCSVVVDRLLELSPNGGSLILLYPTKKGAETFKNEYLGPILDPHVRSLLVVKGLSSDIGTVLASLASVKHMDDFETMKRKVVSLCQKLSQRNGGVTNTFGSQFTMVHSRKGEVTVDRKTWAEWYIQQESTRVREVLDYSWRNGYRLPENGPPCGAQLPSEREITSATILREVLDGVSNRAYAEGTEPQSGLELGMFVIRRTP